MKHVLLITISFFFSGFLFSQNGEDIWTKDAKNELVNEGLSSLSINYPNLPEEQKDNIAICYSTEIPRAYPKRTDWTNKSDLEIKKLKKNMLDHCLKTNGGIPPAPKPVEPVAQPKAEEKGEIPVTKENLIGHWQDDNSDFWLFESGDYKMQYNDGKTAKGTWKVDNNQLDLYKDGFFGKSDKLYKILVFTKNKFVYQSLKKSAKTFTAIRLK